MFSCLKSLNINLWNDKQRICALAV
uniref:Uncharacterized protein n=1 Tax=Tetranychus urticae TaxID=32264 RepID=T1JUE1_TETUR